MISSHLEDVVVTVLVELHIKFIYSQSDAAASCRGDVPETLSVCRVTIRVVRAVEGTTGAEELTAATCRFMRTLYSHDRLHTVVMAKSVIIKSVMSAPTSSFILIVAALPSSFSPMIT